MEIGLLARQLSETLSLTVSPVALTFVDEAPPGVPGPRHAVPSACSFWRDAENGTFYATAEQHMNCPVGAMVMGFELIDPVGEELGGLVTGMCDAGYLAPDEVPKIPGVSRSHAGIIYGPLAESAGEPDVVLMWLTPEQAMLCNEAMGTANWAAGAPAVTGRPGCGALPTAISGGQPVLSFGCAGMRTFTRVGAGLLLLAVPGAHLEPFALALAKVAAANNHMTGYYQGKLAAFDG